MHGHGHVPPPQPPQPPQPPPQPRRQRPGGSGAAVLGLRVLFCLLTLVSCGLLAWAALLRLAIVTGRTLHWTLFVLAVAFTVGCMAVLGMEPDTAEATPNVVIATLLLLLLDVAVLVFYLYAEIRHFAALSRQLPPMTPQFGYGYPGPQPQQHPQQQQPQPQPQRHTPPPQHLVAPPIPSTPPAPRPRIDQVRAELDDLSDLLRNQREGR
ncbi:hypothetical protein ACIOWG_22130 [Streptomyces sp. NPDC087658]|uniref:hypothetical protein n=1 Tax=Streptomyces sp. NPDC087658 TaxID=3365800 RepID=UPI0037FFE914